MILLVGYGNPLRRDDGLGPALVESMAGSSGREDLRTLICHQLTPELAGEVADPEVAAVIFADASALPGPQGGALIHSLAPAPDAVAAGHCCSPESVLLLAEHLYGRRPPAWLVALPGADFGFGEGFSGPGRAVLAEARRQALELLSALH